MKPLDPRQLLRDMFDAAVAAAQPALCVPRHLPAVPKGRPVVIGGAGKASAAMARSANAWPSWGFESSKLASSALFAGRAAIQSLR